MFRLEWTISTNPTASGWGTRKETGNTWATRPSGTENQFQYTGQYQDEDLNYELAYYGARYYDQRLKIFTSVDPMWAESSGWGSYIYVKNNPVLRIDLSGLVDIYCWFGNSGLTDERQEAVMRNLATTFKNAGVEDVNVEKAGYWHRFVGPGREGNIDLMFKLKFPGGGQAGAATGYGSREAEIYMVMLVYPTDDPDTDVDELVNEASNVAAHEAGHASEAKLKHNSPGEGTIMDDRYNAEDWGKSRKDFEDKNAKKLRKAYNKKKTDDEE
jgi:RHS repeat-associated protein